MKGELDVDARGLIMEAYRIEGITGPDCRTIFLDWAIGLPAGIDQLDAVDALLAHYGAQHPDHPMTEVLREGRTAPTRRHPGRRGRSGV